MTRSPEEICHTVARALGAVDPRIRISLVTRATSITEDLGFDSISLVRLAATLENLLEVEDLPFQDWLDKESRFTSGGRHTVGSLAEFCHAALIVRST